MMYKPKRTERKWKQVTVQEAIESPKVIWTFWHKNPPDMIIKCINTWAKWNPDYVIKLLSLEDIPDFGKVNSHQRLSDYVRLEFLSKYGGVWCDAGIVMTAPLPKFEGFHGYWLEKFTTRPEFPVIESWFFACPKEHPFVVAWRDAFYLLKDLDPGMYVKMMTNAGVDIQNIDYPKYLAIHVAAQYVLQKLGPWDLHLEKAEDGPYKHNVKYGWHTREAIAGSVNDPAPLIKFTGTNRFLYGIPEALFKL